MRRITHIITSLELGGAETSLMRLSPQQIGVGLEPLPISLADHGNCRLGGRLIVVDPEAESITAATRNSVYEFTA